MRKKDGIVTLDVLPFAQATIVRTIRDLDMGEKIVMVHLSNAWNAFLQLPASPDQQAEFRHGLHALQYQIMSRPLHQHLREPKNG